MDMKEKKTKRGWCLEVILYLGQRKKVRALEKPEGKVAQRAQKLDVFFGPRLKHGGRREKEVKRGRTHC